MDLNKLNTVKAVDAAFTFPNREDSKYNTGLIIFRDNNNHPFLIYVEKMDVNVSIAEIQEDLLFKESKIQFEYSNKIIIQNGIVFSIIDLKPPKSMTKEKIEEILGYRINIIT